MAVDNETSGPVGAVEHPRGLFKTRVDNKGRVNFPAAFQKFFDSKGVKQFYVTTKDERLAYIVPLPLWKEKEKVLDNPPNAAMFKVFKALKFRIAKYGGDANMDGEGRVLLPQELRDKLKLNEACTVWLQYDQGEVQLYNETEYQAQMTEVSAEDIDAALPEIAMLGF